MFCLLYLTTELGSCVLGDKIVITQESLQEFVNALSPGAYSSITRINFRSLDNCLLKPMGVYGSKEEIVRFLREIHAVDDKTAQKLLLPRNETTARGAAPILRSGLYAVRSFLSSTEEQVYVLYWPEDTTWNDQAVTSVQRNRVTFMRYLTKLCDQLVCLLSAEHSQAIAWDDEDKDDDHVSTHSEESDNVNWLHYVEVVKANDQEENVAARPGFTMSSRLLVKQPRMRLDPKILSPRLLHGETVQGFMTANFRQEEGSVERFAYDHQSASQIPLLSEDDAAWCLSETLDDNTLENFMILGPGTRFSKEYDAWKRRRKEITQRFKRTLARRQTDLHVILERDSEDTKAKLRAAVVGEVLKAFPSLRRERFLPKSGSAESADPVIDVDEVTNPLRHLFSIYPKTISTFQSSMRIANFQGEIRTAEFQSIKARILILHSLLERIKSLNGDQIGSLAEVVLHGGDKQTCLEILRNMGSWRLPKEEEMWRDAIIFASQVSDSRFLLDFKPATVADCLHDAAVSAEETAYDWLAKQIESVASTIFEQVSSTQKEGCNEQASREVKSEEDRELGILRSDFVRQIEDLSIGSRSRTIIYVDTFEVRKGSPVSCSISGRRGLLQNQEIEYHVHCLRLLADQRHNLKLDPSSIPTPILNEGPSQSFCIPSETVVKYAHLLEGDRILMCLVDSHGNVMVILEPLSRIDNAIQSRSFAKFFYQDKIGQSCLFAVDESKRMLAVYASTRMQLQIFIYDEEFKSLQGLGSPIDLLPFYNPGVSIIHICFVHGREELLLVDSGAQARIFSLITMRPKPSSLQLPQVPRAIYSSPDGSYVLVVQRRDGVPTIMAYHWSTFTCTDGIPIILPDFSVDLDSALLSSIVNRNNVHLIGLDLDSRSCRSVILDITHKPTDFTGQEWRSKALSSRGKHTVHNCLIHCHVDVWSRFPVVPVAKLQAITSSRGRQQKALVFITDDDRGSFSSHFSNIVHTFERTSRKPTGEELKNISVSTRTFPSFANQFLSSPDWPVSRFRAGEWLANLLCLIPVQIAITHRNRFVPLKDGVVSTQLEKSLLGAGVNRIVDNLSLGWYESIFQSYWASKPVKVVSSMGEQSVGNSFTLNHVVDTSFAESAMRDIEGVWMSVSPTDDALIVALDLGGIHSLERSSQEDALLVLFSTAISNLVLFQSNLALSRDISGPFQAFRSCSSMWDPASNPSLFQSTLLVTIKDIIDSDRTEVSRELSLKFQKIVMDEPEANFITRLHRGKLQIISWPVIDSKEFYKPFAYLKKKLGRQPTSHRTAGKFLHTLKILMAKLNANDWRSMSQAMAAHRASALLEILPNALETGFSKVVPELEPLKNLDTDLVIEAEDTDAQFSLIRQHTPAADCELRFTTLLKSWERIPFRQRVDESEWTSGLVQHLTRLVDLRTDHVDKWLKSNIQGFHADDTNIEDLRRTFDSAVKDLREMNQLCKWQCDNCGLICIQSRLHEGGHDCLTNHKCICYCSFCRRDLSVAIPCGQNAGHAGNHV
ncbi:hypothetical protein BJV78DRAFT_1380231 [Lactifluus subvellereus]|nr:hypothetical protein BJV78DRAFT_1380231 [Lactifluus subvellereus]